MRIEHKIENTFIKTKKKFHFSPARVRKRRAREAREAEEASKPKEIIGKNTGYEGSCYTCPLSQTKFKGSCPITPCSFNITNYNTSNSCCIAIENHKVEFDKWDLQQALGISESKLYKLKEQGELKVKSIIAFYHILNSLRDKPTPEVKDGTNIANFMDNSFLNMEEIQARKSDVLLIQSNIKEIEQKALSIDPRLTLEKVLGLPEK